MLALIFEGPIPPSKTRWSNRFGSPISLTSDSDPVGLTWYKCLARETYAGTYFLRFHTKIEEPLEQPFGGAISITSDSDPVGLAWYNFLARETYAGTYL